MNETAGVVSVDGNAFATKAVSKIVASGIAKGLAVVRSASLKLVEPWSNLLDDEKPTGIPVSLPIFLRAVDSKGQWAKIRYYVYSDVPYDEVAPLIRKVKSRQQRNLRLRHIEFGGLIPHQ